MNPTPGAPDAPAEAPAPAPEPGAAPAAPSALERLQREPTRFSIDQAAAVIAPGRDPLDIAFRSTPRLGAPGGEVVGAQLAPAQLSTPTFGLIGPGGVMPRQYTALVDHELRRRSTALQAFVDMLARRFTGLFIKAGAKHRPTRDPRQAEQVLTAAVGLGTPHLAGALATSLQAVLYHAGGLASRSRSVERLRGMLSEETGLPIQITEFAGGWVRLPPAEQSRLAAPGQPARYMQLGVDAALGSQVWDPPARFLVSLGPLSLKEFEALLPGTPLHTRLVELTRLHVGPEQDFAFSPTLAPDAVPPLQLGAAAGIAGASRLGWTSWLTSPRPRRRAAVEALLQPSPHLPGARIP